MSDGSSIEWCDSTWQPFIGCTRVSPGCDHCYAIPFVHRRLHASHVGLTKVRPKDATRPGVDWNGTVRFMPTRLAEPLAWKKPRRVFVCSMADIFHPSIPFEQIAAVFGVMAATPQHTYLVLTKRPERAREFFDETFGLENTETTVAVEAERHGVIWDARGDERWRYRSEPTRLTQRRAWTWPLPNVHLGTSVEDQQRADERIPELLQCPAALHWVSAEPLLGPIDFELWMRRDRAPRLGHVIVGGESGPGARPFHLDWARTIVTNCGARGVPVFVKQMGANPWLSATSPTAIAREVSLHDSKGGEMDEWPADLRVRELPEART